MSLTILAVRLSALTTQGEFGRTVNLASGMNVIRGANSRGKTQVVQAIIYALGMERMLSARANAPLGSALTSELRMQGVNGEQTIQVNSSFVAVEIQNATGVVATVRRYVKHSTYRPDLVQVWRSSIANIDKQEVAPTDYFLHAPGSASRDRGFHYWLTEFLGWDLPLVGTFSGRMTTLYLDVIFPFILVDQQSWGSTAPRKVDRYQIRDPLRRAVEFLMNMSGPAAEARRVELEARISALRADWMAARSALQAAAATIGARVVGIPEHPSGAVNRQGASRPTELNDARVEVLNESEWLPVNEILGQARSTLQELSEAEMRFVVPEADSESAERLDTAKKELADLLITARLLDEELTSGQAQLAALDTRLQALNEERERNVDLRSLARLGSRIAVTHMSEHNCPTCSQSLNGVELTADDPVISVEDTITLLSTQITTAQKMRDRARLVVEQSASAYASIQREVDRVRALVKSLERDLLAPIGSPSSAQMAERITLEMRVREMDRLLDTFNSKREELTEIALDVAEVRNLIKSLPEGVPQSDISLIEQLLTRMQSYLRHSGFNSYSPSEVRIDLDTLCPAREGFNIDTDVSASDVVRMKIAYLESVRVLGVEKGQHPGLLVLDEPRQQDIERDHFGAILRYLADDSNRVGQVLVTSATDSTELAALIGQKEFNLIDLGTDRLLQPVRG